ncbi:MAG TPA: AraC family transcriptional regulator [Devosia sp.]|jgi:AraC family transcriptional regulator|uniref:AraC family transcriptional regulator n=1 Tax=Devosia sp. TaxID=1871048 RepID=UPI002DDCA228|nr:AraC family transcriptional regulator [Devosia sp.]HEV2515476.1 AraC family transcriptional regulator [Devosia sp.]
MTQSYEDRINRVTAYIYEHLDEPLDLERLADVAAMSPWHWHRVYSAMRGETAAAAVRRLRLMRAANELANSEASVEAIARRSGYDNVQSFTRIFAEAYGMPPARYRREGSHTAFNPAQNGAPTSHYDVEVRHVPAMTIATEPHVGDYMNIGMAFDRLFGRLGTAGLVDQHTRMFGVYGDDPSAKPVDSLRSMAAATLSEKAAGVSIVETRAGDYAVLRHKGPYADMRAEYNWLFGTWLPQSGRDLADAPVLEEYLNSPRDTAPSELLTILYLPLV